jgi:leucyl-tRNA synthetase
MTVQSEYTDKNAQVVQEIVAGKHPWVGGGKLINSREFNDFDWIEAKKAITERFGRTKTTYKLRDWLVSRQRYWGAPIPIIYCDTCGMVPVPEKDLPVLLPRDIDFIPTGESPLKRSASFQNVSCPRCGKPARRESDTLDTFVCSSWYYLRFADPHDVDAFASKELLQKWLPVDLYMGGAEHTVLHLLYARFFTKVLQTLGYISFNEPFLKLRHQGIILAEDGRKMSKSFGNVINPDEVVSVYGADSLRVYEMFMGPIEQSKPWNTNSIIGSRRFLERVWGLYPNVTDRPLSSGGLLEVLLNQTVKKVTGDIEGLKFNTAISAMMVLINAIPPKSEVPRAFYETLLKLLAPFAPHISHELWELSGHTTELRLEAWPVADESKSKGSTAHIAIQINGKTRGEMDAAIDSDKATLEQAAREAVAGKLEGKTVSRVIVVPNRLVNFVVAE